MYIAKNTVEKKKCKDHDWEKIKIKNKKSDEQYVLNKPKVLYKQIQSAVVFTYLPNKC